jgi:hypothetical protein
MINFKWVNTSNEWIVSFTPKDADGPVYGFGKTKEDALIDYIKAYEALIDFAYDSCSLGWKEAYIGKAKVYTQDELDEEVDLTKHGNIVDKLVDNAINDLNTDYRNKMKSFIKLCRRECVSDICLIEYLADFINSNFDDAYEYFCSKGMIQTEQFSKIDIIKYINRALRDIGVHPCGGFDGKHIQIVGKVMKMSGGKLDPNIVKDIVEEYLRIEYKDLI